MLDGLGIQGVKPVDKDPSRHPNGKNQKNGQKFSLDGDAEEKKIDKKKKPDHAKSRKKPASPSLRKDGKIDIVI